MYKIISELPIVKCSHQGKVRDIYDLGESLLIVTSDRISAFDVILPDPIEGKGRVLTSIAVHFFETTKHIINNHFLSDQVNEFPVELRPYEEYLAGRSMLVRKLRIIPFECIVRGYISGSAWSEYQREGTVCGMPMPAGMKESERFPTPIFTPSTKASEGHDINVSFEEMSKHMDGNIAQTLRTKSLELYQYAHELLLPRGIVIADTKFEFGTLGDEIILADEALTPDSSRFWELADYAAGKSPQSYDKQIVRDYLLSTKWDKTPPAPSLPADVAGKALTKYLEIQRIIVGES